MYSLKPHIEYQETNDEHQIHVNCPFGTRHGDGMEDIDFKMSVNLKNGLYFCYFCGACVKETGKLPLLVPNKDGYRSDHKKVFAKKYDEGEVSFVYLDSISSELSDSDIASDYVYNQRGILPEEVKKYNIRVGRGYLGGRIVFPFMDGNRCRYFVARTYTDQQPKYINKRSGKSLYIYGLEYVDKQRAILTEGILSGIAATRMCNIPFISVLGKTLSDLQLMQISSKVNEIIVCLDGGVLSKDDKRNLSKRFYKFGIRTEYVDLPNGLDPDDMYMKHMKKDFINALEKRKEYDSFKELI